jgi:HAD superfamily hydrolase (TIGR01509 family)
MKAIIFDVDGTLVDSEQAGHMPACNEAFATFGYDIQWDWPMYKSLLHMNGNQRRMRYALSQRYPTMSATDLDTAAVDLFALKKSLFIEKYAYQVPVRDGVVALLDEALAQNVKLAIVTMTLEAQVRALLARHLPDYQTCFQPILGKETGDKTASDSPLHRQCLQALGTQPGETLMIEDSEVGFKAAQRAGIPCAVIYNDYTFGEDFTGARLVAKSLAYFDLETLSGLCLLS